MEHGLVRNRESGMRSPDEIERHRSDIGQFVSNRHGRAAHRYSLPRSHGSDRSQGGQLRRGFVAPALQLLECPSHGTQFPEIGIALAIKLASIAGWKAFVPATAPVIVEVG